MCARRGRDSRVMRIVTCAVTGQTSGEYEPRRQEAARTTMLTTTTVRSYLAYVDGALVPSISGRRYGSMNPFTGEVWAEVPDCDAADVDLAVAAARRALTGEWAAYTQTARGKLLERLAQLITRDSAELAELETRDNGKLLREMLGQMASLPDWYTFFGGLADK